MVKVYYSSNLDAINWKIYAENQGKNVSHFPTNTEIVDVTNKLCQVSLFDSIEDNKIYVVNISDWKLADNQTKQAIRELHAIDKLVLFVYESSTVKNKIFSELKIELIKATAVTKKAKTMMVSQMLLNNGIKLDSAALETMVSLLPDNINFIQNEILKLKLLNQKTFTSNEIKNILFDLGDATVFNIVDSWLNGKDDQTIERLNDLISKNITIQAFIPIFTLKLLQIKFFLSAKLAKWPSEQITAKQGLPFWQQNLYSGLRPYDKNLKIINETLDKLYKFDINVKKQKNIPYTQLIKILFR